MRMSLFFQKLIDSNDTMHNQNILSLALLNYPPIKDSHIVENHAILM